MVSRFVSAAFAGLVLIVAAACGGESPPAGTAAPGSTTTPRPVGVVVTPPPPAQATCIDPVTDGEQISVTDLTFPDETRVAVGETITWNNESNLNHTVSFRSSPDCGIMLLGQSISVRFEGPGTYQYFCSLFRPNMAGVVVVE